KSKGCGPLRTAHTPFDVTCPALSVHAICLADFPFDVARVAPVAWPRPAGLRGSGHRTPRATLRQNAFPLERADDLVEGLDGEIDVFHRVGPADHAAGPHQVDPTGHQCPLDPLGHIG